MTKDAKIFYEPHPVTPERKAELRAQGFTILDAAFDPNRGVDAPSVVQDESAQPSTDAPFDIGTDSGEQFSDEQLRAIIEQETGSAPHHRMGRAKLIETFNALNAKAAGE